MPLPIYTYPQYRAEQKTESPGHYQAEREQVRLIIDQVRLRGDAAVREYTQKFDGVLLEKLQVADAEISAAAEKVDPSLVEALHRARDNIERFHQRQVSGSWWDTGSGWVVGQRVIPLQSVGVYVPGGTAAYPSSVLMTVTPARVAGVRSIFLCTPPGADGAVNPLTLVAARIAGASAVYKAGGAQAVAALAYGTETIPPVQKIVGPGNLYVTLAKREVYGSVGIDMPAGPSEIVVVAEDGGDPACIAADLLSQAEHDPLSRPLLITTSRRLAQEVVSETERQLRDLPRKETAERSLREQGAVIIVPSLADAWQLVNEIAPEHLELHLPDPWRYLDCIENAGAVFLGLHTPEPLGDYWAGSNHVLPTGGAARYASPLGVADFTRSMHVLCYTAEALEEAAPWVEKLARAEGLEAHARSVEMRRLKNGAQSKDRTDHPGDGDQT